MADVAVEDGDLLRQARAFHRQVDDSGQRQGRRGPARDEGHRPRDCGLDRRQVGHPAKGQDQVAMAGDPGGRDRVRSDERQAGFGALRHVHLGLQLADFCDEIDQPADLGLGRRVDEAVRQVGPGGPDQRRLGARRALPRQLVPQLLGDEGHDRVHHLQGLVEGPGGHGPGLGLGRLIGAHEHRFGQFQIPVAEHVPDEAVQGRGGVVETAALDGGRHRALRLGQLTADPAVDGLVDGRRVEALDPLRLVHLREARGIPQLGAEVAITFNALPGQFDVTCAGQDGHGEAQRIGAQLVDDAEGVDHIPLRLAHLLALLVADQAVDDDPFERNLIHEVKSHHHHPGDPEEDDVRRRDEIAGRVEALEVLGLLRPAHGRERPQGRAEPCVQHVLVLRQRLAAGLGDGLGLTLGDVYVAVRVIPGRDAVAPPQLARDAPRLDVAQPFEIDLLVALRLEHRVALLHRLDGRLGQGVSVDVPLVRQPRLDHHARAVAVGNHVAGLLDRLEPPLLVRAGDDGLARGEAVHARIVGGHIGRVDGGDAAEAVHDVQRRQPGPLADLKVVEVMRRCDLHRARALGRVGVLIGHDRDAAADDRQGHELAHQPRITRIIRMHRHAGVAQHGLGPGRRHHDVVAGLILRRLPVTVVGDRVLIGHAVRQGIGEMPVRPVHLTLLDLEVRDRRLEMRVPVHQPLVAIDQPVPVQLDEDLAHGGVQPLVEGEPLAAPVTTGSQPAQLLDDGPTRLGLPFPDLGHEGVAAHVAAADIARGRQLALDHHLGGDAGVVRARQPQHGLTLHPVIAGQDVLQGVVERVADVQRAGHVRRWDDDRIGLGGAVGTGGEHTALLPPCIEARFGGGGIEGLVEHEAWSQQRERAAPSGAALFGLVAGEAKG